MSQRRSRKRTKSRREVVKRPELRAQKGAAVRAREARDRAKRAAQLRQRQQRPAQWQAPLRIRPEGAAGAFGMYVFAWLLVAAIAGAGLALGRWWSISFPDSAWLFVSIGAVAVAPCIGYVARAGGDVWGWTVQPLLIASGMLGAEYVFGPPCPSRYCGTVGARGAYHLWGSLAIVLGAMVVAVVLGRIAFRFARKRRRRSGYVAHRVTWGSMLLVFLLVGLPISAALVGADSLARTEPERSHLAVVTVEQECFGYDEPIRQLAVRPSPNGRSSTWSDYAVGLAHEHRARIGKKGRITPDDRRAAPTPYEAVVSINRDDEVPFLSCRNLSPSTGIAPKRLAEDEQYGGQSPIRPPDLLKQPGSAPSVAPAKSSAKARKPAKHE